MRTPFLLFLFLVVLLPLTVASDTQHRFLVCVQVDGGDKTATALITAHLKRELRALGDVDIVGYIDEWEYLLKVFYVVLQNKTGAETGYFSIASSFSMRVPRLYFLESFSNVKVVYPPTLAAAYWPRDNLQEWCIMTVGDINDRNLDAYRSLLPGRDTKQ